MWSLVPVYYFEVPGTSMYTGSAQVGDGSAAESSSLDRELAS